MVVWSSKGGEEPAIARRTKRRAKSRTTASATTPAAPPALTAGQRHWVIVVPYEERQLARHHGASYYPGIGWIYTGARLPDALSGYRPEQYSWEEWVEANLNEPGTLTAEPDDDWADDDDDWANDPSEEAAAPGPTPTLCSSAPFHLRPEQQEDADAVVAAHAAGAPEFLVANDVGTGKTAISVAAAKQLPDVETVLVVCPLGVIPVWRSHLRRMGDGGKRWVIINYASTKKLVEAPASAQNAKRTRTKNLRTAREGKPRAQWDLVITDESHNLSYPETQQSTVVDRVIGGPNGTPSFVLRVSATAGSNPAQLAYLHRGLRWRTGARVRNTMTSDEYVDWCDGQGVSVTRGRYGNDLVWERNDRDLNHMHTLLFDGDPQWGVRRTAPWDEPQRYPLPVALSRAEREAYETEWARFEAAMDQLERARAAANKATKKTAVAEATAKGRAAQMRYRQKVGQIKARGVALNTKELLDKGIQVAISCEYLGAVDAIIEALDAMGVPAAKYTGENRDTREQDRLAFQRGDTKVIVFTPPEGFDLHANDGGVEGASSAPRATIVAEPRWSPKRALQVEGRCHRDHQLAPVYYTYAEDTVDERVISVSLEGIRDTKTLMGDSLEPFSGLSEALGVPMVLGDS